MMYWLCVQLTWKMAGQLLFRFLNPATLIITPHYWWAVFNFRLATLVKGPSLVNNPYSWNKLGNVLYLESPAGVGFSYSLDGNVTTDDDETALNNHHALLHFLDKFPEYEGRKLYVTGESYGGVYVPTLALLLKDSPRFKLRGIAVGNGLTSYKLNDNSFLYYIRYHGFIGGSSWNDLLAKCCADQCSTWWCAFTDNKTRECQRIISQLAEGPLKGINRYNIYSKCAGGVDRLFQQSMPSRRSVGENSSTRQPSNPYIRHDFGDMFRDNHYMKFLRDLKSALRRNLTTRLTVACVDDTLIRSYLNSPVVRRLINVKPDVPKEWDICSDEVNGKYIRTYDDLSEQYMKLLQSRISTLIYNGDIDVAFNYLGGEMFVDNLKLKPTLSRRFWLYTESDGTKQIGGYWKMFESHGSILTYATVRGAGHKVPADKPAAAFQLINTFINEGSSVERKSKKIHLISLLCVISFFISSL
uniref:Carboxypeptidase n=1 Tax=Trichobilharzia regenti TaxID=157069 RepID=A0AA85J3V6_TRIRE|nr:unnamed protein product [Trichobilharzia regenti]